MTRRTTLCMGFSAVGAWGQREDGRKGCAITFSSSKRGLPTDIHPSIYVFAIQTNRLNQTNALLKLLTDEISRRNHPASRALIPNQTSVTDSSQ